MSLIAQQKKLDLTGLPLRAKLRFRWVHMVSDLLYGPAMKVVMSTSKLCDKYGHNKISLSEHESPRRRAGWKCTRCLMSAYPVQPPAKLYEDCGVIEDE